MHLVAHVEQHIGGGMQERATQMDEAITKAAGKLLALFGNISNTDR